MLAGFAMGGRPDRGGWEPLPEKRGLILLEFFRPSASVARKRFCLLLQALSANVVRFATSFETCHAPASR